MTMTTMKPPCDLFGIPLPLPPVDPQPKDERYDDSGLNEDDAEWVHAAYRRLFNILEYANDTPHVDARRVALANLILHEAMYRTPWWQYLKNRPALFLRMSNRIWRIVNESILDNLDADDLPQG